MKSTLTLFLLINTLCLAGQPQIQKEKIEKMITAVNDNVINWRRHLHQFPELSNREYNTSAYIASHLKSLGLKVDTQIAYTGVVAVLESGKPGPTIGLRADMDALPVRERVNLPFSSKAESEYLGEKVGVMHACGHDAHVAMLMGVATILTDIKKDLLGKVVFIFQPAEEGAPPGEEGGAELMIKEGLIEKYGIEVVFGLHVSSVVPVGRINYRPRGIMAASDEFTIRVKGKQTHGSRPWDGVDPISVSAQIILGLQQIVSRQSDLTKAPAVITIGKIQSGVRNNIIPEEATMIGTIRTLDTEMQDDIHQKMQRTITHIAESAGATADLIINKGYPVTYNNPELTARMLPSLEKSAGEQNVVVIPPVTGSEDFSFYAQKVPGLFFFLGAMPPELSPTEATLHHTPDFYIDERCFPLGMRTLIQLTLDYKN